MKQVNELASQQAERNTKLATERQKNDQSEYLRSSQGGRGTEDLKPNCRWEPTDSFRNSADEIRD